MSDKAISSSTAAPLQSPRVNPAASGPPEQQRFKGSHHAPPHPPSTFIARSLPSTFLDARDNRRNSPSQLLGKTLLRQKQMAIDTNSLEPETFSLMQKCLKIILAS